MWLTGINYFNKTEPKLTILFECRYELLVLFLRGFCPPHFISSFTYHHTIATEGHSPLEQCVLCRAVNKSMRTTAAEIELQLYKIFLNSKRHILKEYAVWYNTKPLAKFSILFQKLICFLNFFFAASTMVHITILKITFWNMTDILTNFQLWMVKEWFKIVCDFRSD